MAVSGHLQSPNPLLQGKRTSTPIKYGYRDFCGPIEISRQLDWKHYYRGSRESKIFYVYIVGKHTPPHKRTRCNPTSNYAQNLNCDSPLDATGNEIKPMHSSAFPFSAI